MNNDDRLSNGKLINIECGMKEAFVVSVNKRSSVNFFYYPNSF